MDGSFEQPPPSSAFEVELARDVSADAALRAVGQACVDQIQANERLLRQSRLPEALHQIRVGLRRWRTALSAFKPLSPDQGAAAAAELKWLAGELDEARDLDVFIETILDPVDPGTPGLTLLRRAAEAARASAYDRVATALASERYGRLLREGVRAIEASDGTGGGQGTAALDLARKALSRRRKAVAAAGRRLEALDAAGRHELRIRAKKARYTAELFAPMFGRSRTMRRYVKALKDLQEALGELNDIHVGRALALRLAEAAGPAEAGFAAGLICGSRLCGEKAFLAEARKAYGRFAEAEPFW